MSLYNIFDVSASGMKAQSVRLTTTASNLSNANVVSGDEKNTFKAHYPIFSSKPVELSGSNFSQPPGVEVQGIYESDQPAIKRYQPSHPLANEEGYVFLPNVNVVEEMTNMISASKSYRMNVEVLSTAKELMARTLQIGQ